jgi:hypothetical protein
VRYLDWQTGLVHAGGAEHRYDTRLGAHDAAELLSDTQ